jgi:indolepyruvate ferredoxin oxidoreductase, beta subunit
MTHSTNSSANRVVNVIIAGLGGQGVLTASDILAEAAFVAGLDVKKADVHGMAQRGGSVRSDVRFGPQVHSPMVPHGETDFLLAVAADQVEHHRAALRPEGQILVPEMIAAERLASRRSLNIALLGVLSRSLEIPVEAWHEAICRHLKPAFHSDNLQAFEVGRSQ